MTGTCLNVGVSGTNIVQLCEAKASYSSSGGDSGGPVFRVLSGSDVELVGIHWGSGGYFSDWYSGVQDINELYLVSTCASGYSC
jgi:secreted trypsin-like serine protease